MYALSDGLLLHAPVAVSSNTSPALCLDLLAQMDAFHRFRMEFYWWPGHLAMTRQSQFLKTDAKCLENVFLALWFDNRVDSKIFLLLHDPNLRNRFWDILRDLNPTPEPKLFDIALRDYAAHAMIFLEKKGRCGYFYAEYHRNDGLLCQKLRKRCGHDEWYVSLDLVAEQFLGVLAEIEPTSTKLPARCEAKALQTRQAVAGDGYLSYKAGDLIWMLSETFPSQLDNLRQTGYVYCFNSDTGASGWAAANDLAEDCDGLIEYAQ